MRIVGLGALDEFAKSYPDCRAQLEAWVYFVGNATWRTPMELKESVASASILGGRRVIFNIKGNHYRMDTRISYQNQIVQIIRLGTHAEYDRWEF